MLPLWKDKPCAEYTSNAEHYVTYNTADQGVDGHELLTRVTTCNKERESIYGTEETINHNSCAGRMGILKSIARRYTSHGTMGRSWLS
jgi:hypothetical protein